jgi:hypothetical protein
MRARILKWLGVAGVEPVKVLASDIDPDYRIELAWRDHLAPVLREAGFKGSGRHFRRIVNGFAECISLQGSRYGGKFAINLGIQPLSIPDVMGNDVDPRKIDEISCEFRRRLSETDCDQWWSYTQLISSKVSAAENAAEMFQRNGLKYFAEMTGDESPLLTVNPISFESGLFDFRGFKATEVRMARSLSLLRLASGDIRSSKDFARIALEKMGSGVGLRVELNRLAGLAD